MNIADRFHGLCGAGGRNLEWQGIVFFIQNSNTYNTKILILKVGQFRQAVDKHILNMIHIEIKKNDIKVYYRCGPRILVSEDERKTVVGDAFASRNDYCLKSIRFK